MSETKNAYEWHSMALAAANKRGIHEDEDVITSIACKLLSEEVAMMEIRCSELLEALEKSYPTCCNKRNETNCSKCSFPDSNGCFIEYCEQLIARAKGDQNDE